MGPPDWQGRKGRVHTARFGLMFLRAAAQAELAIALQRLQTCP